MSLSGFFKFIVGFFIGIFLLAASGAVAAYYFWTRLSITPSKPIFAEEQPKKLTNVKKTTVLKASNPKSSNTLAPTPSKPPEKELPPGAFKARVTWKEGLSLRDAPSLESNRIGGVGFNQQIYVLKESDDGKWQQVRLVEGAEEGWIKAGNTEKVNN